MRAFGHAGVRAGGFYGGVSDSGVTLGRDFFLCYQHFTASSTVLAFGPAGIGAGCFFTGNNFFGMAQRRDYFLGYLHFAAAIANMPISQTCLGTGSRFSGNCYYIMRAGALHNVILIAMSADRAGVFGVAVLRTGRCHNSCFIVMTGAIPSTGGGIISVGACLSRIDSRAIGIL